MKKCAWCGNEYPDSATACALDQQPLTVCPPPATATPDAALPGPSVVRRHPVFRAIGFVVAAGLLVVGLLLGAVLVVLLPALMSGPGPEPEAQMGHGVVLGIFTFSCIAAPICLGAGGFILWRLRFFSRHRAAQRDVNSPE